MTRFRIALPRSRRATLASTALAALATLTTLAGPAVAAERTVSDPDDIGPGVDLRQVRVVNDQEVRIIAHHDDLRPHAASAGMTVYLDTDATRRGPEFAFSAGLVDGTDFALSRAGWSGDGTRVGGEGCSYRLRIDYARDISRVRIARGCLDDPAQVRVAVRATGGANGDLQTDWLTGRRAFTGWVARG